VRSKTDISIDRAHGAANRKVIKTRKPTSYRPGGGETICPPSMAVRLAADLRPSADGSAVRTSLVAGQLQAASVPIAQAAAPRSQRV